MMVSWNRNFGIVVAIAMAVLAASGCDLKSRPTVKNDASPAVPARPQDESNNFIVNGSSTLNPIAVAFAEHFKGRYTVAVKKTGSGEGLARLAGGQSQVAAISREIRFEEAQEIMKQGVIPVPHPVALDATCVIVNPANQVKNLTVQQLRDIYSGKVTNWKQLGGADARITPVHQEMTGTSYQIFKDYVVGDDNPASSVQFFRKDIVTKTVASDVGAISYINFGKVDARVKALAINGVPANRETVSQRKYLLVRPLYFVTNGQPKFGTPIYEFVNFWATKKGQELVVASGFVPLTEY